MKFLFQKGNTYGKGRIRKTMSSQERSAISTRIKKMWRSRREEMVQKVKDGMAAPRVRGLLSQLNSRKRRSMSDEHKGKISDKLVGKEPKNMWAQFFNGNHHRSKRGWLEIADRKIFMKSTWERNYARYLQWLKELKEIVDWEYEPKVFIFDAVKFGNRAYRPDFRITYKDERYEWHEIKGWMDKNSRTKLNRMRKFFPDEKVILIDAQAYGALAQDIKSLVPGWESGK